jgi:pimeloyl-ACP methyl ester carboxylesterase
VRALIPLLALALCSCSVIQTQQRHLEGQFRQLGLTERTEDVGDARVHFYEGGEDDGTPVLLLHGFGASAIWQWHSQAHALAKDRRVIIPNLLWFGGSSSENRDFRLDHQVLVVRELLKHLDVEQVDVVGISYGGVVAWALANEFPEAVRRAVIMDSPGTAYTDADYADLLTRFGMTDSLGPLLVPSSGDAVQTLMELAYYRPPTIPKGLREQVVRDLYGEYREEKVLLLETMVGQMDELRARAREMTIPTLVVWGDQDPVFPLEIAHRLAERLGENGRLQVIKNAKHAPNLEHRGEVNRLLREFLLED